MSLEKAQCHFIHSPTGEKGGVTLGYLREATRIVVGISYCHENDVYNRKEGSDRAFSRVQDYLKYGSNAVRKNVKCLRDANANHVIAFEVPNAILLAGLNAVCAHYAAQGFGVLGASLVKEEAQRIARAMVDAINVTDLNNATYTALDGMIQSFVKIKIME